MRRKYGRKAQNEVRSAMGDFKRGKLRSGKDRKPVKSRKQAIAIGLSKARKKRSQGAGQTNLGFGVNKAWTNSYRLAN